MSDILKNLRTEIPVCSDDFLEGPDTTELQDLAAREDIMQNIYKRLAEVDADYRKRFPYKIRKPARVSLTTSGIYSVVSEGADASGLDLDEGNLFGVYGDGFSNQDLSVFRHTGLNAVRNGYGVWFGDLNQVDGDEIVYYLGEGFSNHTMFKKFYGTRGDGVDLWLSRDYHRGFSDVKLDFLYDYIAESKQARIKGVTSNKFIKPTAWQEESRKNRMRLSYRFGEFPRFRDLTVERSRFVMTFQEICSVMQHYPNFLSESGVRPGDTVLTRTVCNFVANSDDTDSYYLVGVVPDGIGSFTTTFELLYMVEKTGESDKVLRPFTGYSNNFVAIIN